MEQLQGVGIFNFRTISDAHYEISFLGALASHSAKGIFFLNLSERVFVQFVLVQVSPRGTRSDSGIVNNIEIQVLALAQFVLMQQDLIYCNAT